MSSSVGVSPGGGTRQPTKITEGSIGAAEASRFREAGAARQKEREAAIEEVRQRGESSKFPSMLSGIGGMVRQNIISALERGARPVQVTSRSGKLITVGALESDGTYTGQSMYRDVARDAPGGGAIKTSAMAAIKGERLKTKPSDREEPAPTQAAAPAPTTPPTIPVDTASPLMGAPELGRGIRTKRSGAAGTLLEGGGILYE